jgi:WD40 repeat protein
MRIRLTLLLVLLGLPDPAAAQAPLRRLGDTRFRPGVRITHLAFSPDGKQLASWGNWLYFEDRLSLWDTATGKEPRAAAVAEHRIAALSWGTQGFAVVRVVDDRHGLGAHRIWCFTDPSDMPPPPAAAVRVGKKAVGGAEPVESYEAFALAPDASKLAAFRTDASGAAAIDLFEAKACNSARALRRVASRDKLPTKQCRGLQVLPDGRVAILMAAEGKTAQAIVLWDPVKDRLSEPTPIDVGLVQGERQTFDVTPDGSAVVLGLTDGTVKVIEVPSGKERLSMRKHGDGKKGVWQAVCAVKFVNDGRHVLSAGRDEHQRVWDAQTGAVVAELDGHVSWVEAIAVSPNGKIVATAGQDSLIRLWDTRTWRPLVPPEGPRSTVWRVELSRDGKYAAALSGDGVHAWDLASGWQVFNQPGRANADVLFAPTGELLVPTVKGALGVHPLAGVGKAKQLNVTGHLLDFTPDGKQLLTADSATLLLWDWPAGTKRAIIKLGGRITSAAVAPDSSTAAVRFDNGKAAMLIDLATARVVGEVPCQLHWFARAAGFALGGRVLCGTVGSPQAEMWNIATRSRVRQFELPPQTGGGHFYILSFAISADGRRAASCQSDGGVTVYETATGQVLAHFRGHREGNIGVHLSADGDRVISGGGDHAVLVWDVSLRTLGAGAVPLAAAGRARAWDDLSTQLAKEAVKVMAALAADPDGTVAWLADRLRPDRPVDGAVLDRIFRELDDDDSAVRSRASAALNELGETAVGAVRARQAKTTSAEVRRRADQFLSRFATTGTLTPERLRIERTMEVLAVVNTAAARDLVRRLAAGAAGTWMTDAAQRTLARMN